MLLDEFIHGGLPDGESSDIIVVMNQLVAETYDLSCVRYPFNQFG